MATAAAVNASVAFLVAPNRSTYQALAPSYETADPEERQRGCHHSGIGIQHRPCTRGVAEQHEGPDGRQQLQANRGW